MEKIFDVEWGKVFWKKIGCRHSDDKREFISVARLKNMNEHSPNTEIVSK